MVAQGMVVNDKISTSANIHKECLNNLFCFKIITTNTLVVNVCKMFKCDKNQLPYCDVQNFKK